MLTFPCVLGAHTQILTLVRQVLYNRAIFTLPSLNTLICICNHCVYGVKTHVTTCEGSTWIELRSPGFWGEHLYQLNRFAVCLPPSPLVNLQYHPIPCPCSSLQSHFCRPMERERQTDGQTEDPTMLATETGICALVPLSHQACCHGF